MKWRDAPYYYNERATLSLFAAALWTSGFIALEEYRSTKGRGRGSWQGRTDMFFAPSYDRQYVVETKQRWPSLKNVVKPNRMIETALDDAVRDAEASAKEARGLIGLGVVFVVPIRKGPYESARLDECRGFVERIKALDVDGYAYALFPEKWKRLMDNGYAYPGVAMLLRRA